MPLMNIRLARIHLVATLTLACASTAHADDALTTEATELGEALGRLDQSFEFHGLRSGHGSTRVGGSRYDDRPNPPAQTLPQLPPATGASLSNSDERTR